MNEYDCFQACIAFVVIIDASAAYDQSHETYETRVPRLKIKLTNDDDLMPLPEDWKSGIIPYALNFFSPCPKRLLGLVKKGIDFLENNTCLKFEEQDPVIAAQKKNYTYLYFTYSGVAEDCCLKYYTKDYGRRTVLITPVCSNAHQVAHASLHGLGLAHSPDQPFNEYAVAAVTQHWCALMISLRTTTTEKIETTSRTILKKKTTYNDFHHRWCQYNKIPALLRRTVGGSSRKMIVLIVYSTGTRNVLLIPSRNVE
ncbi:astacin (Peptidase family m12A) domain-containing protein [Phthorimaea operculella]|nr:astacin (Peptidase family m12A) domain-containing protein [Phthorimaea operculella]